jgi:hypothetical protein
MQDLESNDGCACPVPRIPMSNIILFPLATMDVFFQQRMSFAIVARMRGEA